MMQSTNYEVLYLVIVSTKHLYKKYINLEKKFKAKNHRPDYCSLV